MLAKANTGSLGSESSASLAQVMSLWSFSSLHTLMRAVIAFDQVPLGASNAVRSTFLGSRGSSGCQQQPQVTLWFEPRGHLPVKGCLETPPSTDLWAHTLIWTHEQLILTPSFWSKSSRFCSLLHISFVLNQTQLMTDKAKTLRLFSLPTPRCRMFKHLFTARILLISSLNIFSPKASFLLCSSVTVIFYFISAARTNCVFKQHWCCKVLH